MKKMDKKPLTLIEFGVGYSDEKIQDLIKEGYIPIATAEDLDSIRNNTERVYGKGTQWERKYTGGIDKKYIQVANIDLSEYSEEGWTPIGSRETNQPKVPFTGTYDGGNYVITDLEVKGDDKHYQGLFGYTEGATISNVGLINNKVTGSYFAGGLVGLALNSTINNSYATGPVTGYIYVGGLVGHANTVTEISNSYSTGSVTGNDNIGGLVGYTNRSNIRNSYATGSITGGSWVGGLVGFAAKKTEISNSYATGSVSGASQVGGFVGYAYSGTMISNSYATGTVTGTGSLGGLVGMAGGSTTISNSYWDKDTTRRSTSYIQSSLFGKTTVEMMKRTTYKGWDFNTVWEIDEGNDYPKLR